MIVPSKLVLQTHLEVSGFSCYVPLFICKKVCNKSNIFEDTSYPSSQSNLPGICKWKIV